MHSPETTSPTICKNCEAPVQGNFCSNCSQRADTHRFSIAHFGHEFFHAFTHTDKGILLLMKELLYKPGKIALEYNAGKRKKYFNPITFLLIATAVQFFIAKKTEYYKDVQTAMEQVASQVAQANSDEDRKQIQESLQDSKKQSSVVQENSRAFMMVMIPFLGFFSWLFFKKSGHNYAENLVLHVLITGGAVLIFLATAIIPHLLMPSQIVPWLAINFILTIAYNIIAYKQFFQQSWLATIIKGFLLILITLACYQLITFVIIKIMA